MTRYSFVPAQPDYPAASVAHFLSAALILDEQAHFILTYWWNRLVPLRSYVHGWKIGPSHYANQDLSTVWPSAPQCGEGQVGKCPDHARA